MAKRRKLRRPARPRDAAQTKLALLRAAEKLFSERGVDAVSMREVSVAAGLRNNSAVLYHFKSREGLIDAVLERHADPIQARYVAQLELLERQGPVSLRTLLDVLIRPLLAKLDDPDGGFEFVSISAQLTVNPSLPLFTRAIASTSPGAVRMMEAMTPLVQVPPELLMLRTDRFSSVLYSSLVAYARERDPDPRRRELFLSDLIDTLSSIYTAPASAQTQALLDETRSGPR